MDAATLIAASGFLFGVVIFVIVIIIIVIIIIVIVIIIVFGFVFFVVIEPQQFLVSLTGNFMR